MRSLTFLAVALPLVFAIPWGLENGQTRLIGDTPVDGLIRASSEVLGYMGGPFSEVSLTLTVAASWGPSLGHLMGRPPVDPDPKTDIYEAKGEKGENPFPENPEDYDPSDILYDDKSATISNTIAGAGCPPDSFFPFPFRAIRINGQTYSQRYKARARNLQLTQYLKRTGKPLQYYQSTLDLMLNQKFKMHVDHIYEIQSLIIYSQGPKPQGARDASWNALKTMVNINTDPAANPFKMSIANILHDYDNLILLSGRINLLKGKVNTKFDKEQAGLGPQNGPNLAQYWARSTMIGLLAYMESNGEVYKGSAQRLRDCILNYTNDPVLAQHFYDYSLALWETKKNYARDKAFHGTFQVLDGPEDL